MLWDFSEERREEGGIIIGLYNNGIILVTVLDVGFGWMG